MKLYQDSREQTPLDFSPFKFITEVCKTRLIVGDYGCRFVNGHIPTIFIERKSVGDLFGTLGKGHKRFRKELERARENNFKLILMIEGDYKSVLKGYKHSTMKGATVVKVIHSLWVKHELTPVFCANPKEMAKRVVDVYSAIGRAVMGDDIAFGDGTDNIKEI